MTHTARSVREVGAHKKPSVDGIGDGCARLAPTKDRLTSPPKHLGERWSLRAERCVDKSSTQHIGLEVHKSRFEATTADAEASCAAEQLSG